jgi:hypothetical protein
MCLFVLLGDFTLCGHVTAAACAESSNLCHAQAAPAVSLGLRASLGARWPCEVSPPLHCQPLPKTMQPLFF